MSYANGIISITTSGGVTYGVAISDVQKALGRGVSDIGLLCSDQEWYENDGAQALRRVFKIRPMAKFKPVRHSKLGILTLAERASTRYGFGSGLAPTLDLTQTYPQNDWEYKPPRGMANNEWFRIRDFEGYSQGACAPLALMVGQLVYDGESQILVFGDGMSNSVRSDGGTWVYDESLSLTDLLQSGSSLYGYYVSFLIIDKTGSEHEKNLIVTNMTMNVLVNSGYSHGIFKIFAQGATDGGLNHPAVPVLAETRSGHTFEVIMCLMPGNNPQSGDAYAVYTQSDTPGFLGLLPYSLGFESGCDRVEASLESGAFKMDGTQVTGISVIVTDMAMEQTLSGQVFRAYSLEIRATFSTVNAEAYTGTMGISGFLSFTTSGMFGPSASEGISLPPQGIGANKLASKTAGQNRLIWSSGGVNYMWIPKVNGSVVRTSLYLSADFSYPFSSGQHATGSTTVYVPN